MECIPPMSTQACIRYTRIDTYGVSLCGMTRERERWRERGVAGGLRVQASDHPICISYIWSEPVWNVKCICTYFCTCMYIQIHTYVHIYVSMYIYVFIYMYIYVFIYIYTYIHTYNIYIYTYMYLYIHIYIYIYIHTYLCIACVE